MSNHWSSKMMSILMDAMKNQGRKEAGNLFSWQEFNHRVKERKEEWEKKKEETKEKGGGETIRPWTKSLVGIAINNACFHSLIPTILLFSVCVVLSFCCSTILLSELKWIRKRKRNKMVTKIWKYWQLVINIVENAAVPHTALVFVNAWHSVVSEFISSIMSLFLAEYFIYSCNEWLFKTNSSPLKQGIFYYTRYIFETSKFTSLLRLTLPYLWFKVYWRSLHLNRVY